MPDETLQCRRWCAITRPRSQPGELLLDQRSDAGLAWTETQLVIEPPGAGVQALVVIVAELIRIDRERVGREQRADRRNQLRVDPGRFASSKGLEDIERELG